MNTLHSGDVVYVNGELVKGIGIVCHASDNRPEEDGAHRYVMFVTGIDKDGAKFQGNMMYSNNDVKIGKLTYINGLPKFMRSLNYHIKHYGLDTVNDNHSTKSTTILDEASSIVDGDREQTYGHPSLNFERTAVLWSVIFGHTVTLQQVALAMVCLKLARQVHQPTRDNLVDAVGYLRCIEKMMDVDGGFDVDVGIPGFGYLDDFEKVHGVG